MKPLIPKNPLFRLFSFLLYEIIAIPILYINGKAVLGLSIRGRKNLRALRGKGAVLVCNHIHTLDCTFVSVLAAPRKVIHTAEASTFGRTFIGPLIRLLGAVPVPPPDSSPYLICRFIRQTSQAVRSGRLVCVYPEGKLIPYCPDLREFRDGAFLIAALASAPVVPVVITFRERKGLWRLLKRRPCLTVTAETPIEPVPGGSFRETAKELCARTRAAMEKTRNRNEK